MHSRSTGSAPLVTITPVATSEISQSVSRPPLPWSRNQSPVPASCTRQPESATVAPPLTETAELRIRLNEQSFAVARDSRSSTNSASGRSCSEQSVSVSWAPSLTQSAG